MKANRTLATACISIVILAVCAVAFLSAFVNSGHSSARKEIARLQAKAKEVGLVLPKSEILAQPTPEMKGENALPIYSKIGPLASNAIDGALKTANAQLDAQAKRLPASPPDQMRAQPAFLANKWPDQTVLLVAKSCRHLTAEVASASKLKYCLSSEDLTMPYVQLTFSAGTNVSQCSRLLAIDAEAAEIKGDIDRARDDLLAMTRLPAQLIQKRIMVNLLTAVGIQRQAASAAFDGLIRHPNDPKWAQLSLEIDQRLPEIPFYQAGPSEWMGTSSATERFLSGKGSQMLSGTMAPDDQDGWPGSKLVSNLKAEATNEYPKIAVALLNATLASLQTQQLQYSDLDKEIQEQSALQPRPSDPKAENIGKQLVFTYPAVSIKQWRINLSMLEIAAEAVLHRDGQNWPKTASLPQPAFVPPAQPISSPNANSPMITVSLRGWEPGSTIEYESSSTGFSVTTDFPKDFTYMKPIPDEFAGGHKNAMRIVWKDGHLWAFNLSLRLAL